MTDPKNRDDEPADITSSGEPDDADLDSTEDETSETVDANPDEPTDETGDTDRDLDDEDVEQDAVDDGDVTDRDDEPARERKEKPVPTGKASRSGNPARAAEAEEEKPRSRQPVKPQKIGNRWAAPAMLACAGIGLLWIVLYYVFANRDNPVPVMSDLGDWNLIVGMGFIVAAFGFSMKWE